MTNQHREYARRIARLVTPGRLSLAEELVRYIEKETARRCAEIAETHYKPGRQQYGLVIGEEIRREYDLEIGL